MMYGCMYPGLRRAVYHRPHATVLPNKVVPVRMLPSCLIRLYTRPHATVDGGMLDRYGLDTYRHSRARTSELGHIHSRHESRLSVSVSIPLPCALALPSGGARSFTPNLLVVHTQHPRTARAPSPSPPRDNEISRSGSPRDNDISRSGSPRDNEISRSGSKDRDHPEITRSRDRDHPEITRSRDRDLSSWPASSSGIELDELAHATEGALLKANFKLTLPPVQKGAGPPDEGGNQGRDPYDEGGNQGRGPPDEGGNQECGPPDEGCNQECGPPDEGGHQYAISDAIKDAISLSILSGR